MLHILFVRKNGEVDSVTLFKVTIFIRWVFFINCIYFHIHS